MGASQAHAMNTCCSEHVGSCRAAQQKAHTHLDEGAPHGELAQLRGQRLQRVADRQVHAREQHLVTLLRREGHCQRARGAPPRPYAHFLALQVGHAPSTALEAPRAQSWETCACTALVTKHEGPRKMLPSGGHEQQSTMSASWDVSLRNLLWSALRPIKSDGMHSTHDCRHSST